MTTKPKHKENTFKLLLVDDDISIVESVGRVMRAQFEKRGYENIKVFNIHTKTANEATKKMKEIKPTILLFDHNYESIEDGFDIVKVAKNDLSKKIKKIISITSSEEAGKIYLKDYGVKWIKKMNYHKIINEVIEFVENN